MPSFDSDTGRILFLGGLAAVVALLVLSAPVAHALRGTVGMRRAGVVLYGSAAVPIIAGGLVIGGVLPKGMWTVWMMVAALMAWGVSLVAFSAIAFLRSSHVTETQATDQPPVATVEVAAQPRKPPRASEIAENPALPEDEIKIRCTACGKKMRAPGLRFAKQRRCPNCKASPFRFETASADASAEAVEPADAAPACDAQDSVI